MAILVISIFFTNTNNDIIQLSCLSAIYQEKEFQEADLPHRQLIAGAHLATTEVVPVSIAVCTV